MKLTRISGFLLFVLTNLTQGTAGETTTVRLTVVEPSGVARSNWPVTSGVPLGRGVVRDGEQTALFGWPLHLMLNAYEATGEERHLAAAGKQWNVLEGNLDPQRVP